MGPTERALALAADQHGAIAAAQLTAIGLHRRAQRRAVEEGWLTRGTRGVYVVAGSVDTVERRLHVGLLRLGSGAVVSHEAAARLHRFDRARPDAVEFTVPRDRRNTGHGLRVHSTETFGPVDRLMIAGFPCTSATRTIIDLARLGIERVRLEAAIDSSVRTGASSPTVLAARLAALRGPGWHGARLLDALLPDTGGHSPLERSFLGLIRRAGLPRPTTQLVHRAGHRTFARVDFCFEEHGVVVEVSGRLGHASDAERERDEQRRRELETVGRRVRAFTGRQVREEPDTVLDDVRAALAAGPLPPSEGCRAS